MGLREDAERAKDELLREEERFYSRVTRRIPEVLAEWSSTMGVSVPSYEVIARRYKEGIPENFYTNGESGYFDVTIRFTADGYEFRGRVASEGKLLVALYGVSWYIQPVANVQDLAKALKTLDERGVPETSYNV